MNVADFCLCIMSDLLHCQCAESLARTTYVVHSAFFQPVHEATSMMEQKRGALQRNVSVT